MDTDPNAAPLSVSVLAAAIVEGARAILAWLQENRASS
jgi:hypothetical protein